MVGSPPPPPPGGGGGTEGSLWMYSSMAIEDGVILDSDKPRQSHLLLAPVLAGQLHFVFALKIPITPPPPPKKKNRQLQA